MSLSPVAASAVTVLSLSSDSSRSATSSASPPAVPDMLSDFSSQYPTMSSLPSPPLLTPDQVTNPFNVDVNALQAHLSSGVAEIDPFTLHDMAIDNAMVQDSHELDPSSAPPTGFSISPGQADSSYIPFSSTMNPSLEQAMTIELPTSSNSSSVSSPLPAQIPSPSLSTIHTNASYGSVGVTPTPSSLQSALALDPTGRAAVVGLTSSNLPSSSASDLASGSSGGVGSITFPMAQDLAVKKEDSALSLGGSILEEIVKSASAAASLCRSGRGAEASRIVGDLGEKLAFVSDVISGMSGLTVGENGLKMSPPHSHSPPRQVPHPNPSHSSPHTLSQAPVFTTNPDYYPPPSHPQQAPLLVPIPESSQLVFSTGTGVTTDPDVNIPVPLSGSLASLPLSTTIPPSLSHISSTTPPGQESSARKRCASDIEVARPIKALKAEPQEELLYNLNTSQPLASPKHTNTLQSPPPSRPTTPPSAQTAFVFNPVKTPPHSQTTSYPPSSTPSSVSSTQSSYGFNAATASAPDLVTGSAKVSTPVFPPLRSAWSESVVPTIGGQSRHSHSLSTGSITTTSSSGAGTGANSPVSHTGPVSNAPTAPQSSPSRFSAGVNGRINGRMTRSGSIGTLGTHPFTYTYPSPSQLQPPGTASSRGDPTTVSAGLGSSGGTGSGSANSIPTTAKNSPEEFHEGDEGDDGDDEPGRGGNTHTTGSGSDVPQEYRSEVDRIFFEFLNKVCSNLDATDAKGDPIHQTLMPKKMQRLDESPDFRPFKFRILAFTTAFLEELARQGYPEEKIPMKKIRNYLWRHPFIQRYNEDGKKAKSKGNYIWNVEARKTNNSASNGQWEFRPFHRKLAGIPPAIAYCGLKWSWHPHIWDPQASFVNIPVHYSSPNLPSWLTWKGEELSGTPPAGAESCDIRVDAKFVLDGQEGHLSTTFHLNVAPRSSVDSGYSLPRSQSDTLLHQAPMRARVAAAINNPHIVHSHTHHTSVSTLSSLPSHTTHTHHLTMPLTHSSLRASNPTENAPARVVEVLQNVAQRVTEEAATTTQIQHQIHATPVTPSATANANAVANHLQDLVKQKQAVVQSLVAYDRALTGPTPPETHRLAIAAQSVVAEAAQSVSPGAVTPLVAIQTASVGDMTDGVQEALAVAVQAVKMQSAGHASDLEVIEVTRSLLASKNSSANQPPGVGTPMNGVISTGTAMQSVPNPYPSAFPVSSYV